MSNFWNKFIKKNDGEEYSEEDTIPIRTPVEFEEEDEITKPLSPLSNVLPRLINNENAIGIDPPQLLACCAQSVGKQRDHNEDAMLCLTTTLSCNGGSIPFGLYIVADGMGGHQHGEVASEIAIRTMSEYVIRKTFMNLIGIEQEPPEESI